MHFSIWPVTISPGQPPKQVQPFGHRGGELFEAVLSQGRGWGKQKICCEVRVIFCAVCTMAADLKTVYV